MEKPKDFKPEKPPYDLYDVPHFGEDEDIKTSKKNMKAAEESYGYEMQASFKEKEGPKRDYFVPNFGEDQDIKDSKVDLSLAEKITGEKLVIEKKKDEPEKDYFVPNWGYDQDVADSKTHLADAEKTLKHSLEVKKDGWGSFELIQTDADLKLESDPICSSAGCTQYKHKKKDLGYDINYPVPNFGRDHDINENNGSLDWAENSLSHHWTWKKRPKTDEVTYSNGGPIDEDIRYTQKNLKDQESVHGVWELPPKDYAGVQLESDPICSSAGCTQYKHKKKDLGYDINYFVPHFGADTEINESKASLVTAEAMIGHKFDFPHPKYKKPKAVKYVSAAPFDEDVVDTQKNLADSEAQLGHKWVLDG